ncbi:MAG: hypothetical protein KUG72_10285 [Pseudomonadales bacterium]|nr:hypothetical protein [Pseudomonadales bacterium]
MSIQISIASEDGSATAMSDLSIKVDNLEIALSRLKNSNIPKESCEYNMPAGLFPNLKGLEKSM